MLFLKDYNNTFSVLGAEVLSTSMSVTFGGPPDVILRIGVAISTFLKIEGKTGSLESTLASLSLLHNVTDGVEPSL